MEVLPNLIQLEKLGYFHSHPQWGNQKGRIKLSECDRDSMEPGEVELVIAINDAKKRYLGKNLGKVVWNIR